MIPGWGIKQPQPPTYPKLLGDGGVASWYRVRDDTCHRVQGHVIDTELPDKILNVTNMFLMRFWCKDGLEEPATVADLAYVANLLKSRHSMSHNRELVRSIHDLFHGNWVCVTGVNNAFIIAYRDKNTVVIEDRPVFSNKSIDGLLQWRVKVGQVEILA